MPSAHEQIFVAGLPLLAANLASMKPGKQLSEHFDPNRLPLVQEKPPLEGGVRAPHLSVFNRFADEVKC